jgi:splicing factor 45
MDLYGDLPEVKGEKKGVRADTGFSKDKLESKKAMESVNVTRIRPAMSQVAVKRHAPSKRESLPSTAMTSQPRSSVKTQDLLSTPMQPTGLGEGSMENAYDPAQPNDYEKIMEEKRNKRFQVERELARLRQERLDKQKKMVIITEKEEEEKTPAPVKGMNLAQKMLEKMGWKKGQGLGKHKQGIPTALAVEKTNARSGRVVLPSLESNSADQKDIQPPKNPPSRVIILTNVVGPGGVDESLDQEVGEECSESFGEVTNVLIFEVTEPTYPPDRAVRIFVEFADQDSAMKAVQQLNGRYFDGRVVRADFFDQRKFDAEQLAPSK